MATREDELLRKYEEFQREGLRFMADFFKAVGEQGSTDPEKAAAPLPDGKALLEKTKAVKELLEQLEAELPPEE